MGILQRGWKRLASWAAEGVWQWIICYLLFTPGAWAGATITLKHYGAPMTTALLVGAALAAPMLLAIAFFRNHAKMMVVVRELQSKLPPISSDPKPQPEPASVPRLQVKIVILGIVALALLLLGVVIRITGDSSSSQRKITITSQHENEIVRAVRGKWGYSEFQNMKTDNLPNNDYFLEYSHMGNPYDVILVREIDSPSVTPEISSKLKNANRFFADQSQFHHVDVVLTIYRNLELSEKVSLRQQMDIVKGSEPLGANVSFDLWDKTDLDKYGALVP